MKNATALRWLWLAIALYPGAACRCGAEAGGTGQKKVLSFLRTSPFKSLDPVKQFDEASSELLMNLYDTLLEYHYLKRPYHLEPNLLARMPEVSGDGLKYTFELRSDVRFNDDPCFPNGKGRLLTSDDVIYSLKRFADANLNIKSYTLLAGVIEGLDAFREQTKQLGKATDYKKLEISGLQKLDDHRFAVTLTHPNPLALYPLAAPVTSIVPREAVERYGQDFENHPVGTGPFKVKQFARRGLMIFEKNPRYHELFPMEGDPGDRERGLLKSAGQRLPLIDEIQLPLIEETQPAMLKFQTGQLDWVAMDRDNFVNIAFKDASGFHLKPAYAHKFVIYSEPYLASEYFTFNMKDPLLGKNKALRQALAYALNTPEFVEKMKNGRGVALQSIVPIPIAGSERDTDAHWYPHSIELAKQKLAEAGYPDGKGLPPITVEYRHTNNMVRQDFEFHRATLEQAGIVLKANFQTFTAFLEKVEVTGNFQVSEAGWQADYPDAENFYQLLYGPNKVPGPNSGSYVNPEYDKLYEQSRFMPNGKERYAIFARMNEILREDLPMLITWTAIAVGLHQHWLTNFKRNMMLTLPAKYFDIDPELKRKGLH